MRERSAEYGFGAVVVGFQTACVIYGNHAAGEAFQHAFQIMARGFLLHSVALGRALGDGELLGHVVEQMGEAA